MADENILEVNAVIDLSEYLPKMEEMVAAAETGMADIATAFQKLNEATANSTTELAANTEAQLNNNAARESGVGLADEELFGPVKVPAVTPEPAAPARVGTLAAQKAEEAAAVEAANAEIRTSETATADIADEFESRFNAMTNRVMVDADEFAVEVSAATKKVADDLAELASIARIQQAALTEAFRIHGDAAALGAEEAVSAISDQLSNLAITKAQVDELKVKLKELAETEVKQAAGARESASAAGQAAESYGKTSAAALEAAASTQKLTEQEAASAEAYKALIAEQAIPVAAAPTAGGGVTSVVDEAAIAASAAAFENYATDGQLAAEANQQVADTTSVAMEAVSAEVDAVSADAQAYLRLAEAQVGESAAAEASAGILSQVVNWIQQSIESLFGQATATNAVTEAEQRSAAAFARLAGVEEEETVVRRAGTSATADRTLAEEGLNTSFRTGISNRQVASQSLMVMEGTMRSGTRAAGALLTEVLGLGPVFQFAFPIIGAVALIEILGRVSDTLLNLIDKANLTAAAVRKIAEESANLQIKADDTTRSLEAENLTLEDMIAKIEGRPATNKLAIALIEISNKADQLSVDFQKDFDKIGEEIDKQTTKAAKFKTALGDAFSLEGVASTIDFDLLALGQGSKISAQRKEEYAALKQVQAATEAVGVARQKVYEIENALSGAKNDKERIALSQQLQVAYGEQATAVGKLVDALNVADLRAKAVGDPKLAAGFSVGVKQAQSDIRDLGAEIDRVGLTVRATQEAQAKEIAATVAAFKTAQLQGKEKLTLLDIEGEKEAAAAVLALAQQTYKKTVELAVQAGHDRAQAELDALPALENAERIYAVAVANAARTAHEARVTALDAEIALARTSGAKQGEELRLQLQNLNNQLSEENQRYANEKAKIAASAEIKITEDSLRESQARVAAQKEALKQEIEIINQRIAAAKKTAESGVIEVKTGTPTTEGSEEQIERINQLYREGMITFRQYQAAKIVAIESEKSSLDAVYGTEKGVIQTAIAGLEAEIVKRRAAAQEVADEEKELERLKLKIQEVDNAQQKADDNAQRGIAKTQGEVSKYALTWTQFLQKFNNEQGTMWNQFRNASQQAFLALDKGFSSSVSQLVLTGKGFGDSMAQVWNKMLADFAGALAQMLEKFIVHEVTKVIVAATSEQEQTAAAAVGATERDTIGVLADLKSIARAAATAAAHAFKWVMEEVPFPANAVLAPAAAAGAFISVLAFQSLAGSAAKGALLDQDMPLFAHAKEMVLPAPISTGLQNVINTGGLNLPPALSQNLTGVSSGSTVSNATTNHYHNTTVAPKISVQVNGDAGGLKDLHQQVVSVVRTAVRRGALNFGEI